MVLAGKFGVAMVNLKNIAKEIKYDRDYQDRNSRDDG